MSLVIDAMSRACGLSERVECVVLGDGPQRADAEQQVASHGLQSRIRFLGRLGAAQVRRELADCQAILMMSDYEGLPVALLEAMALGVVPVVRKISGGIPEIVHSYQTGLLVSADPAEAAEALVRLAADSELWTRCATGARERVSDQFNQAACWDRWSAVLRSAAATRTLQGALAIPARLQLPAVHPALVDRDRRRPSLLARLRRRWPRNRSAGTPVIR